MGAVAVGDEQSVLRLSFQAVKRKYSTLNSALGSLSKTCLAQGSAREFS